MNEDRFKICLLARGTHKNHENWEPQNIIVSTISAFKSLKVRNSLLNTIYSFSPLWPAHFIMYWILMIVVRYHIYITVGLSSPHQSWKNILIFRVLVLYRYPDSNVKKNMKRYDCKNFWRLSKTYSRYTLEIYPSLVKILSKCQNLINIITVHRPITMFRTWK